MLSAPEKQSSEQILTDTLPSQAQNRPLLTAGVVVFVVLWAVANSIWLANIRLGQPHNIDEDGYFTMALNNYFGWMRGGPAEWLRVVFSPSIQAPLVPAVVSLGFLVFGPNFAVAFGVNVLFGAAGLLLTAYLARMVGGPLVVWIALIFVATAPGFLQMSRTFIFATPATAIALAAIVALVKSRGLKNVSWSLVFGLFVGLLPLTRSVTIAFVPGFVIAAVIAILLASEDRRRRIINVIVAGAVAMIVAASWLMPSFSLVFGYLTEYGYGSHTSEYKRKAVTNLASFIISGTDLLLLPHFLLLVVGILSALIGVLLVIVRGRFALCVRNHAAFPLLACAVIVAAGSLALISTSNRGLGFALPLVPLAAVIAAWGVARALRNVRPHAVRGGTVTLLILGMGFIASGMFSLASPAAVASDVLVPDLGRILVTQGRNVEPAYGNTSSDVVNESAWASKWEQADSEVASLVIANPGGKSVAFGIRNHFFNVNTVQASIISQLHYGLAIAQIDPQIDTLTFVGYRKWLTTGSAKSMCLLVTSPGKTNEFAPVGDDNALRRAARVTGFAPESTLMLPDSRFITVWQRQSTGCTSP